MTLRRCAVVVVSVCVLAGRSTALTGGPTQPEFSSFEPVDVTDLVNLPTGDFTYVLPLGEVKGPADVGYPVALSYHAGIQNEQEASWVGLGWTLNVGAINRMLRGAPDDANADRISTYMKNEGENGWNSNIGGGWGPVSGTVGWSNKGFQGVTSVGLNYSVGPASVGMTLNLQSNTVSLGVGTGFAAGKTGTGVGLHAGVVLGHGRAPKAYASVGLSTKSRLSLASFSIASDGNAGFSVAGASGQGSLAGFSSAGLSEWGWGFGLTIPLPYGLRVDFNYAEWGWKYEQLLAGRVVGYLYHSTGLDTRVMSYDQYLAAFSDRVGSADVWKYLDARDDPFAKERDSDATTIIRAENISHKLEYVGRSERKGDYYTAPVPAYASQDVYQISGQGISGAFKPYSYTSMAVFASSESEEDGAYGVWDGDGDLEADGEFNAHRTGFAPHFRDGVVFRCLDDPALNLIDHMDEGFSFSDVPDYPTYENIHMVNHDQTLKEGRVYGKRIQPIFGLDDAFPYKLSGFVVTDVDGTSYYYAHPLYTLEQIAYVSDNDKMPKLKHSKSPSYSYREDAHAYAYTWLLTAITGPDYVKRVFKEDEPDVVELLRPHDGDWGYWVSFRYDYGMEVTDDNGLPELAVEGGESSENVTYESSENATYAWSDPFMDKDLEDLGHRSNECSGDEEKYTRQVGKREITYLKSIETASEIAYFRTSPRYDGIGVNDDSYPDFLKHELPDQDIVDDEDAVVTQGFDGGYRKRFAQVLKRSYGSNSAAEILDGCLKLRLSTDVFDVAEIENRLLGEDAYKEQLFELRVSASQDCERIACLQDLRYLSGAAAAVLSAVLGGRPKNPRTFKHRGSAKTTVSIPVLWDPTGWTDVANGNPQFEDPANPKPFHLHGPRYSGVCRLKSHGGEKKGRQHVGDLAPECVIHRAKCFAWKVIDDYIYFYVVPFRHRRTGCPDPHTVWTGAEIIDYGGFIEPYKGCEYKLKRLDDVKIIQAIYNESQSAAVHSENVATRYQKKLDEIAWYSKAEYPYVSPTLDCGGAEAGLIELDPAKAYPRSYKRAKFRYDYSLARGTPNSYDMSTGTLGSGGRLTLKEIRMEAGPEEDPVSMPPYLFTYQNADAPYEGYGKEDQYGYRQTEDEHAEDYVFDPNEDLGGQVGVNWNLSKIQLPSCGSIEMKYERDFINDIYGILAMVRDRNRCVESKDYRLTWAYSPWKEAFDKENDDCFEDYGFFTRVHNPIRRPAAEDWDVVEVKYHDGCASTHPDWGPDAIKPGMWFYFVDVEEYYNVGAPSGDARHSRVFVFKVIDTEYIPSLKHMKVTFVPPLRPVLEKTKEYRPMCARFIKDSTFWCDGLRTKVVTTSSVNGTSKSIYEYPNQGGVIDVLPERATPWRFSLPAPDISVTKHAIQNPAFSNDPAQHYNTGNTSVIYPSVTVYSQDEDDGPEERKYGYTKYHFYTIEDHVQVGGEDVPVIETQVHSVDFDPEDSENEDLVLVWDRSAIVGQIKSVEKYNSKEELVSKKTPTYAFSEELTGIHSAMHDLQTTVDGDTKPLGMIRERCIRREGSDFGVTAVSDVIISKPFIIKQTEETDGVEVVKRMALFDAFTGEPMAAEKENRREDGTLESKTEVTVPYYRIAPVTKQDALAAANIFQSPGATVQCSLSLSEEGADYSSIKKILDVSATRMAAAAVTSHGMEALAVEDPNPPSPQTRFYEKAAYAWKGTDADFEWPNEDDEAATALQWRKDYMVESVDAYSRPLSEIDALDVPSAAVHNPYCSAVLGIARNARFDEVAFFPCDYDDMLGTPGGDASEDEYLDKSNGWRRGGGCEIAFPGELTKLFGNRALRVHNRDDSYSGPSKTLTGIRDRYVVDGDGNNADEPAYRFSAWVYPRNSEGISLSVVKAGGDSPGPLPLDVHTDLEVGSWQLIERVITAEQTRGMDAAETELNNMTIEVVGANDQADFYVQDIRFYPADALVKTFYYDYNLNVPIAFVDENNNGTYYKYNPFGRLIEHGVIEHAAAE